ncbi:MAG: 2-hydroxychromene-2-carboxylate isomerase [Burkholderiaceae bacterium]|nr:MAG: 2-hydroxychromene-2-carboxylate isomerase [Burkholderiaceae bacterium]TAM02127.1 MAG: 2-hydroxychromene-2-carboxylate isomerase [Pusillimonas sp.]
MSPYAYLAHHRLQALAVRYGFEVDYRPIDLMRAKIAVGNTGPGNRAIPIKHKYLRLDLRRWANRYGVPFVPPSGYGSQRLNCGTFFALDLRVAQSYVCAAWPLVWGDGGDMNDDALLAQVALSMGWCPEEFLEYVSSDMAIERLRAMNEDALKKGVFGVPTMCIGSEMWWGNDRLHFLEDYLKGIEQ